MHQIRQILDFKLRGYPIKKIARQSDIARNTVRDYLRKAAATGIALSDLIALDDPALSRILQGEGGELPVSSLDPRRADFDQRQAYFAVELKRTGVTKQILWEEYLREYPRGYSYSQFCYHLSAYLQRSKAVMHLTHRPAEQLMADFAGDKMSWVDLQSGEEHRCEILVLTLPFSSMTYVEALPSQRQEHLLPSLGRGFAYLGGVPLSVKFDNLKPAITRPDRYEPRIAEALQSLALHYNTTIMAARPARPRDKASVENAVNKVYQRIFAPLRNHVFHSLAELNAAVRKQLDWHNTLNFKGKDYSRRDIFDQQEKHLLRPLPPSAYTLQRITFGKVQKNYHVILGQDRHQYSVPFQLIGKKLKIIYTQEVVEIYDHLTRVAVHRRNPLAHAYTTVATHLPVNHQHFAARQGWNADYFLEKSAQIGPATRAVFHRVLTSKVFYEQTYNSCLGLLKLARHYGNDRMEAACQRAAAASTVNYSVIQSILEKNLDRAPTLFPADSPSIPAHENVRGPQAYQ